MEALANGTNPETGEILNIQTAYDVINAKNVKKAFDFALSTIDVPEKKKVKRTEPFSLPLEAKKEIQLDSNELLPLSKIISRVNKVIPDNCKKLGRREVRQWLVKEEILSEQTINGKVVYNITEYAIHNGVKQVSSKTGGKSYIVYPVKIQRAIIDNAEEIMEEFA